MAHLGNLFKIASWLNIRKYVNEYDMLNINNISLMPKVSIGVWLNTLLMFCLAGFFCCLIFLLESYVFLLRRPNTYFDERLVDACFCRSDMAAEWWLAPTSFIQPSVDLFLFLAAVVVVCTLDEKENWRKTTLQMIFLGLKTEARKFYKLWYIMEYSYRMAM